jgi:late competence protein required for DNA uptake (superfamily II DNA/RNA helicase)
MSVIKQTQALMGYMSASRRASCGNCAKVEIDESQREQTSIFYCTAGRFCVSKMATCAQHQPQQNNTHTAHRGMRQGRGDQR